MAPATAKLAKAELELCEPQQDGKKLKPGATIAVLRFAFNPKDYSVSLSGGWNFKPNKKSSEPPEFTGNQPRSLSLEMFLDGTEDAAVDVAKTVDQLFAALQPTRKSMDSGSPFPAILVFSWGEANRFVGVLQSVDATYTMFRPDGSPIRASCKLKLQEFEVTPPRQNPTSGGRRARRSHTVVLGDSLASIAHAEYGSPTMWRAVAKVNGIVDPWALRLGAELLIPPPDEAKALA